MYGHDCHSADPSPGATGTQGKPKLPRKDSTVSQSAEFSDSDLTTEDEDDEWEGLPIADL